MSISQGGIFSKQTGKVSGVVFQKTRTRYGKKSAVRELVIPANPQTVSQQANRLLHAEVTRAVQEVGRENYRNPWNNRIRGLPAYQSLLSLWKNMYSHYPAGGNPFLWQLDFRPRVVGLGGLHFPDGFGLQTNFPSSMFVVWTTETGLNGSPSDRLVLVVFPNFIEVRSGGGVSPIIVETNATRGSSVLQITGQWQRIELTRPSAVLAYFVSGDGRGNNVSEARWLSASTQN